MPTTTRLARFLVLALPLAFFGCNRPGQPDASTSAAPAADQFFAYPRSEYVVHAKGKPGGTVTASVALDVGTFDVHSVSHGNVQWLGRLLYDCLIYLDNDGNPTPWLARSWEISPDGLIYTFQLREGVTFSDGVRFDAEAVKVNFDHMRDPATKSPLAGNYIAPIAETKILGPYTIQVRLNAPYHPLLNVLAQSWLGMISPKQIREAPKSIKEHPIGSGPFILTSYQVGERATFKRRDDYNWSPEFLGHTGPAYLEGVVLDFIPEAFVRIASLQGGQHNFTFDAPPQNAASLRASPDYVFKSRVRIGNPTRAISFNTSLPPFNDLAIRRAVALGIDREGITRLVGFGEFFPKSDFLAANTRYYDPAFRHVLAYNPTEANRVLDEAGWTTRDTDGIRLKNGQRLSAELLAAESATPSAINVAVQADLKNIGFDLRLTQLPQANITERRRENKYQATGGGYWHTNTPDGLFILYHSQQILTEKTNGQNSARIADPKLDDVLLRARQATTDADRRALYSEAQRLLTELIPAVPLHESHHISAYKRQLQGVLLDTSHSTPLLIAAWFENPAGSK